MHVKKCECVKAHKKAFTEVFGCDVIRMKARSKHLNMIFLLWLVILCGFSEAVINDSGEFEKEGEVVWAKAGGEAKLPCDVSVRTPGDAVSMVLWFKDSTGMPLYSLDFRNGPLVHWAMTDDLGSRTHFVLEESSPESAHLAVKGVSLMDEGVFRCRVDFMDSPTRNQKVNLSILVSPNEPRIFDGQGREIAGVAGPFREEYDLYLSCQVTGGRPTPEVTWWHNSSMLDSIDDTTSPTGTVTSQLFIGTVTRKLYAARLQCKAKVSDLLPPVVKEVQLQVYLKPMMVHIVSPSDLVAASKPRVFRCETIGSHPVARLSWLLDGEVIRSQPITVKTIGNTTFSIITLVLAASDDGKGLTCRATNPWFPGGIVEDTRTINVAYPPRVSITVGSSEDPETLKEGGDVQLICNAEGRPVVEKYAWFRGGEQLQHNPGEGLVVLGRTMRIRNLTREDTGNYSCKAANSEGSTRSQVLALNILYVPVCVGGITAPKETAAIRHSPMSLRCEVDSPSEAGPVKFSWTYNKTRDVLPIPATLVSSEGTVSDLVYTPRSSADFGTLACWATNAAGHQRHPCLFSIVPARVPEPPQECVLVNGSLVLEVSCRAGADGGIPQHFVLEVLPGNIPITTAEPPLDIENEISTMNDQGTSPDVRPLYRESGGVPHFSLRGLRPGHRYGVMVYAVNARGRSFPAMLKDITVPEHYASADHYSNQEGKSHSDNDLIALSGSQPMAMIIGALGAAALLILLAIISATAVVICKRRRRNGGGSGLSCARGKDKRESGSGPSMYAAPDDENGFGTHFGAPNVMIRPCADIRRDGRRASRAISALEAQELDSQTTQPGREEEIPMGTLSRPSIPYEMHDPAQYGVEKDFLPQRMNVHPQDMDIYAQINKGYLNPQQPAFRINRGPLNNYAEILQNYHDNSAYPGISYRQLGPLPPIPRMYPQDVMVQSQGMRTEPITRDDYEVMLSHAGLRPLSSRDLYIDDSRRSSLDQRLRGSIDSGVSYRGMGVALQGLDIIKGGGDYSEINNIGKRENVGVNTCDLESGGRSAEATQPLLENPHSISAESSSPIPREATQDKPIVARPMVRFELDKPDLIISQPDEVATNAT